MARSIAHFSLADHKCYKLKTQQKKKKKCLRGGSRVINTILWFAFYCFITLFLFKVIVMFY